MVVQVDFRIDVKCFELSSMSRTGFPDRAIVGVVQFLFYSGLL